MLIEVKGEQIEITKTALAFDRTSGRSQGWLGYALARLTWIKGRFREQFKGETKYRYTFEEEFDARESAAKIWADLKEKDKYTDPYFGDLQKVDGAGFFREYVWYCVPHPEWSQPAGLRQEAFSQWLLANLPEHHVETWVAVVPEKSRQIIVIGVEPHPRVKCQVPTKSNPPAPGGV